ncbi:MAG: glycogen/starch/alpha-glucan phosphorylase [Peptococcaceae bacterium]|jgi:starch phosphorylase|nr:glycogen/starch/alpha-glucan phosphorylase [Peptococcaceae bacterium]
MTITMTKKNEQGDARPTDAMSQREFARLYVDKLETVRGVSLEEATYEDAYMALAAIIKERVTKLWFNSTHSYQQEKKKQVYYFSLEFLLGRMLEQNIMALGLQETCQEAMRELNQDLEKIYDVESDPGLGNGGLGRLAACFMDSLAFNGLPGHGCSIRYKYGLFEQKIVDGNQIEMADNWLRNENVWETRKPSKAITVKYFGEVRHEIENGRLVYHHDNYEPVIAMPYDIPMVGGADGTVNNLRLWSAESVRSFNFESFSSGDYIHAISDKYSAEAISEVLYPDDSNYQNRFLRLKQQYFFVSAGVQSIIRRYKKSYGDLHDLADYVTIHINDTHPALAVPELMRILIDEEGFGWDEAWEITRHTVSYTNHTIMPEALERWSVDTFRTLLPRIYMIVHEINERFCKELWEMYPYDWDRISRMAIEGGNEIRMAFLSIVGSHSINGVAKIHSDILKAELFKDFYEIYPERFFNVTNGVTQRRWLQKANPSLSGLITDAIGPDWKKEPLQLSRLDMEGFVNDVPFLDKLMEIKRENKLRLAKIIRESKGIELDPDSIFDVQVKRIHAYKRQLLMAFNIIEFYHKILDNPNRDFIPRTFIFGGKAAPSYHFAKETIRFISTISETINNDERVRGLIKVVFLENYRVSSAERIFPASDLSEQISTASKEASGTGNMKFMFNGAVTIGTLDGANIEIFDAVGEGNYIKFGLTVEEVLEFYRNKTYSSFEVYQNDWRVRRIFDSFINSQPSLIGKAEFPHIYDSLITYGDEFFVLKDFGSYIHAQREVNRLYEYKQMWARMSAMNIAYAGRFSSDEVIRTYDKDIWKLSGGAE